MPTGRISFARFYNLMSYSAHGQSPFQVTFGRYEVLAILHKATLLLDNYGNKDMYFS